MATHHTDAKRGPGTTQPEMEMVDREYLQGLMNWQCVVPNDSSAR